MDDEFPEYTRADLLRHIRHMEYGWDPLLLYGNEKFSKPLPQNGLVYHYTGMNGFRGIVSGGSIWASPAYALNDLDEMHDGARILKSCLSEGSDKAGRLQLEGAQFDLAEATRSMMCHFLDFRWKPPETYEIYTISFCEDGDASNQWMNYVGVDPETGLKGRGFALGFSGVHLFRAGLPLGFKFGACQYDRVEKKKIIEGAVDVGLEFLLSMVNRGLHLGASLEWLEEKFYHSILSYIPFLKNHTFYSEREWRVVMASDVVNWEKETVSVGDNTKEVIRFHLRTHREAFSGYTYLPLFHVVAGAGTAEDDIREARELLDATGYADVSIERSECRWR